MKFCINCGKKLDDGIKFCTGCGTRVEEPKPVNAPVYVPMTEMDLGDADKTVVERPAPKAAPAPAPKPAYEPKYAYQPPVAPVYQPPVQQPAAPAPKKPAAPKKKGSKAPMVLAIAGVALLVVIAVVVLLLSGVFVSDQKAVLGAFKKTVEAHTEAAEGMNLDMEAVNALVEAQEYNQSIDLKIKSVPYYEELSGLGARIDMSCSLPQQVIGLEVTPFYGSADLVSAKLKFADDMLYVGAPDVVDDTVFAVNTETLGQDLYDMGAIYDEESASLSINVFELIQITEEYRLEMEEKLQIPEEELQALLETIEVEKVGKATAEVNDHNVKCTEYAVVIPQDTMEDLLEMVEDLYSEMDSIALAKDLLKAIGAPDYVLEELDYYTGVSDESFDVMYDLLDEIGDIECSVFVNKGYVMAITGELSAYDSDVEYEIQLGGGDNYVDDIGIYVKADGEKIELVSTGDHSAKDGVYTDETTIKMGGEKVKISSSFDPKATDENFELSVSAPEDIKFSMSGLILADENGFTMNLDKCSLTAEGETLSVSVNYTVSAYEEIGLSTAGALEVLKMSEDELMTELEPVGEKIMAWVEKFAAENGELMEMIEYMMY